MVNGNNMTTLIITACSLLENASWWDPDQFEEIPSTPLTVAHVERRFLAVAVLYSTCEVWVQW